MNLLCKMTTRSTSSDNDFSEGEKIGETVLDGYAEVVKQGEDNQFLDFRQSSHTDNEGPQQDDPINYFDDHVPWKSSSTDSQATASIQQNLNYSYADCYNFNKESQLKHTQSTTTSNYRDDPTTGASSLSVTNIQKATESRNEIAAIPELWDPYDDSSGSEVEDLDWCEDTRYKQQMWGLHTNQLNETSDQQSEPTTNTTQTGTPILRKTSLEEQGTVSLTLAAGSECIGIAAYILDEYDTECPPTTSNDVSLPKMSNIRKPIRKKAEPWYCVSHPISEQTKDLKIRQVNRSTSIYFSRLLEKCRIIVEYCTQRDEEIISADNIKTMNHNTHWGDSLPSNVKGNTIRVVYQNVHRSIATSDNPYTNILLDNLNNMEADVFMASETNINWKSSKNRK